MTRYNVICWRTICKHVEIYLKLVVSSLRLLQCLEIIVKLIFKACPEIVIIYLLLKMATEHNSGN